MGTKQVAPCACVWSLPQRGGLAVRARIPPAEGRENVARLGRHGESRKGCQNCCTDPKVLPGAGAAACGQRGVGGAVTRRALITPGMKGAPHTAPSLHTPLGSCRTHPRWCTPCCPEFAHTSERGWGGSTGLEGCITQEGRDAERWLHKAHNPFAAGPLQQSGDPHLHAQHGSLQLRLRRIVAGVVPWIDWKMPARLCLPLGDVNPRQAAGSPRHLRKRK